MPGRKLLSLFLLLLFLFACARRPIQPPPGVWTEESPSFKALVTFRVCAPGRKLSGKAVIISSERTLYVEGFSPLGAPIFSLWVQTGGFYLVSYVKGKAYHVVLEPPCPELDRLWSYLIQGKLPSTLQWKVEKRASIRLGQGYKLTVKGQPPVFKISYRKRVLFEEKVSGREFLFKFPLFHASIRFKWKRKEPLLAFENPPSLPVLPYERFTLKVAEFTDIKAD